jgi:hypothetical protein
VCLARAEKMLEISTPGDEGSKKKISVKEKTERKYDGII